MNRRPNIILMEIMIAILFFTLASASSLKMFAKSRQLNNDTKNLHIASSQAQNVMELMRHAVSPDASGQTKADNFFPACILSEYPNAVGNKNQLHLYYDQNWKHCPKEDWVYCMEITSLPTEQNNLLCYHINVGSIYSFDFMLHIPNRPKL